MHVSFQASLSRFNCSCMVLFSTIFLRASNLLCSKIPKVSCISASFRCWAELVVRSVTIVPKSSKADLEGSLLGVVFQHGLCLSHSSYILPASFLLSVNGYVINLILGTPHLVRSKLSCACLCEKENSAVTERTNVCIELPVPTDIP